MSTEVWESTPWRRSVESRLDTLESAGEGSAEDLREQRSATNSMDVDLTSMQHEFRAQRRLLQSLHLTQQEHTAKFREVRLGQQEQTQELRQEFRQTQELLQDGIKTIIGLLNREVGETAKPDGNSGVPE